MNPEERELRRALGARSAEPTPAYRARVASSLAGGRPRPEGPPVLAVAAAVLLVSAIVGILVVSHPGLGGAPPPAPASGVHHTPTPRATPTSSPAPTPSLPPAPPVSLPTTAQLSVPSDRVVWAYVAGSLLFRSSDGGTTWERRPLPPGGSPGAPAAGGGFSFVDADQGWFLPAASPATQCQAEAVDGIWHTADGGASWHLLGARGIAPAQCKGNLSFTDARHGFMTASDPNGPPVVDRTSDGGRTWAASRPLADPPGFQGRPGGFELAPGPVHAFGAALMLVAEGDSGGTRRQYVFRSIDGGASWTFLAGVPRPDGALAILTPTRWLHLIGPGQSEVTVDGGASWRPSTSDYSQAAPVAPQVAFGGDLVGYATVRGAIQRTVDGGIHWTGIPTPGTA